MRTRRTFLALAASAAVAGCQGVQDRTPAETPTESVTRTAPGTEPTETEQPESGGTEDHVVWRQAVSGKLEHRPALDGGLAFVGTEGGTVAALSATDGRIQWSETPDESISGPVVAENGTVLAVASPYEVNPKHTLYAFDADNGALQWEFPSTSWWLSILGVDGDTAFVGTRDDALDTEGETLYALSLDDGTERWSAEIGDPFESVVTEDRVFVKSFGGLVAAGRDGTRDWEYEEEGLKYLTVAGDTVAFLSESYEDDDTVVGLDAATGTRSWTFDDFVPESVTAVGDQLLVGGDSLASLDDATGETLWTAEVAASPSEPPHADGTVYVVGDQAAAVSLDDGTLEWRSSVDISAEETSRAAHSVEPAGLLDGQLLLQRSLSSDDLDRHLLALDTTTGDRAWSYTADSDLTGFAVGESLAYAGRADTVLAVEP